MASCTVNYNLKDAGYANFANQTLTFTLLTAGAEGSGDYVVAASSVTSTSDANGDGSVTLFVNDDSGIKSIYDVTLPNAEHIQFIIPTGTSTIELANLIVNNQPAGDAETQQSTVYAQAIQRANHTGTQTLSTISDAGTIASQDSNSVSITGGSLTDVSVDLNGRELILDADADTSITSDADDRIDIKVAGTDQIQFTDGAILPVTDNDVDLGSSAQSFKDLHAEGASFVGTISCSSVTASSVTISSGGFSTITAGSADIDGGTIDGATIGGSTAAAVTGTNVLASAQSGYNTGGTKTQTGNITDTVTLNQPSGVITLLSNDFGANTATSFNLSNTFIDINDVVVASFQTGHSELTLTVTTTASNSCTFTIYNPTNGDTGSITAKINFAVIKTATS